MHERLSNSELVVMAGAPHDLHLDRLEEWCAVLERFLADLAGRA